MIQDLISNFATNFSIQAVFVVLILSATWFLNQIFQKSLRAFEKKRKTPKGLSFLINKTAQFVIYGIGLLMSLRTFGIEITAILASLGVGGLAVSFALKDSLTNIISGVMIMLYRPFSIGDHVSFKASGKDFEGQITDIDLRYTTLENESSKILVPNSTLASAPVVISK